ncbi:T9SS type A sorting domain-containing protein [Adhaeribacter sp. BT258]|uniref:T9SS type A sorting domain-containing protein n=1 Tax=Adhaeribacter terrigena TaxID=2793070 RepID=A0ABS1C6P2_9BACT|nr:T9SS type A sorting domain-containing protein [Adhaeribacter terrigena]MBK0404886.1 T9SS type A sorting domain-containing protein [Adhaeribacter terrigena]
MKKLIPLSLLILILAGRAWGQACTTPISTFPYFENFEAGNGNWTSGGTNSSWAWGTPSKPGITGAASGTKAWATNLIGNHNSGEDSYVMSPCFNFASVVAPIFSAKIFWQTEHNWDGAVLQSSIDNGLTWQTVGTVGAPNNWYNNSGISSFPGGQLTGWSGSGSTGSGGWVLAKHALTGLGGQTNVRLRIAFASDPGVNLGGFALDDVLLTEMSGLDLELTSFISPVSGCLLSAAETVCVTITNRGLAAQSNFPVSYQVGSGPVVTETVTDTIAPFDTYTYCFLQTANLSTAGSYTITATTLLTGDSDPSNNTATTSITSVPLISTFPYSQNFENGQGGWRAGGTNSSWVLGTPAKQIIQGAASGVNAWVTRLTGNHNTLENSWVTSPCFNFSALTSADPDLEMKVWWASEAAVAGAVLQSSIDGGATWQTIGTMGQPNNWYNSGTISGNPGGQQQGWSGGAGSNPTPPGSNGWVKVKHRLTGLSGQPAVMLRVAFGSNTWSAHDGFAFDDVRIADNTHNLSIYSFEPLSQVCGFSNSEKVEVMIENLGSIAISNYHLQFRVDGGAWTTAATSTPLMPDVPKKFTFTQTADLSAAGPHSIEVRIVNNAGIDPDMTNNTVIYNVTNTLFNALPVTLDFETPPTSMIAARIVTRPKSAINEVAGTGRAGKGLIMDGINHSKWVDPIGIDPFINNEDNLSGIYICLTPIQVGTDSLILTFDLKQLYKTSMFNTNFRVTVNGNQVGQTYWPPFGGYPAGIPAPWKTIKVNLTPYKNKGTIQIGLESNVKEEYANGTGTANVIDNIQIVRVACSTCVGISENILQSNLIVFPNPSTGLFNLQIPTTIRDYAVEVTDLTGKLVKQQTVTNNAGTTQLNLNGTAKGIYILKIASEGNVATRKLIVE